MELCGRGESRGGPRYYRRKETRSSVILVLMGITLIAVGSEHQIPSYSLLLANSLVFP